MATVKLTHIEKVRNQLRFYREDGQFYYWDFNVEPTWESDGQCWFGLKGKPISKAPAGAVNLMIDTCSNLRHSFHTLDAEQHKLIKYIQLVLFMRGQDRWDSCANWDKNPTRYLGSSWAALFMTCFESFINMGLDIDMAHPDKFSRNITSVGMHFKSIVNTHLDGNQDTSAVVKAFHKAYKELRKKHPDTPVRMSAISTQFNNLVYEPLKNLGFTDDHIKEYRSHGVSYAKMQKYHRFILACHEQLELPEFLRNLYSLREYDCFYKIVEVVAPYLTKCDAMGYSPRKNCDVQKELNHIDEQYRLWCARKDREKLEGLNLEQYIFENDHYTVVLPRSAQDLIDCGNALNNCVGRYGYWEKMVNKHTCVVVFVKDKNNLDKHLVCCEIINTGNDKLTINQFLTTNNCTPAEEVLTFRDSYEEFLGAIPKENVQINYGW